MTKKTARGKQGNDKLAVGVTLYIREGQQSLWENGIFQNCHFLLLLLMRSPIVSECFVVNGGPGGAAEIKAFGADLLCPVLTMAEAMNQLDVVIELSAQLNGEWAAQFRTRGGKTIAMHVANDYFIDMERIGNVLTPGQLISGVEYDQVWTLPAFEKTNYHYYKNLLGAPVRMMQHLWSPMLLERETRNRPEVWGYVPQTEPWRVAILEPNICSVKTSHLAMLACEEAYRMRPGFLKNVHVFNAMALKEDAHFVNFAQSLDIVKNGVASFEPRYQTFIIMHTFANCIFSHQVENAQNYLYYEALHGGYPLIHNSTMLDDCGYYYEGYDSREGGLALIEAMAIHDSDLDNYRNRSARFLQKLDPCNPGNIALYSQAILDCFA